MLFCISFRRRAHWLDNHILYPTGTHSTAHWGRSKLVVPPHCWESFEDGLPTSNVWIPMKENEIIIRKRYLHPMFPAAIFTIAKIWK